VTALVAGFVVWVLALPPSFAEPAPAVVYRPEGNRRRLPWSGSGHSRPGVTCAPSGSGDGLVVFGVVVTVVVGDDDGGAGDADSSGVGAGAGSGGGTVSIAGPLAAEVRGVVTAGVAVDGGTTGAAVVGTGLVSDRVDRSPSLSRAVTDPKPTRKAATQASGTKTLRLRIP